MKQLLLNLTLKVPSRLRVLGAKDVPIISWAHTRGCHGRPKG